MYVQVNDLPRPIQRALEAVAYHCKDITIEAAEEISVSVAGGAGERGFAILVNLDNGEFKISRGSWGGANIFNPNNAVDLDDRLHKIPLNGAVIKGSEGNSTFAYVYVNPQNLAPMLPKRAEVSEKESMILACFKGLKSGDYRQQALRRLGTTEAEITSLVDRGFLKRNKGGATQITTEGKNAAKPHYYP